MRVQTEEWRRFIPGVRMYKGKKTLFYNGEKLWNEETKEFLIYDWWEERQKWEVIIVLPGVQIIPEGTFSDCLNIKTVIMADTVRRIEWRAFGSCRSLEFVKLSRSLEYIGAWAFYYCESLTSMFLPPSCREVDNYAFAWCKKLIIFNVPQHTQLRGNVIAKTALIEASHFEPNTYGDYENQEELNEWVKNRNAENQFSLHRACSSFNPLEQVIFEIVSRQGLKAFKKQDSVGVAPSQYLSHNPFTEIQEKQIIKRYVLDMMGEIV